MQQQTDFRLFLQEELVRRIRTKPGYSMRAFARFLDVDSSRLSKMLRGERPIKPHFIENFGTRVGLPPDRIENFKSLAFENKKKGRNEVEDQRFKQLALDTFEIIADWQHYAILELMKLKGFVPDSRFVAKTLSIQPSEVNTAIERLQRVGLLRVETDGSWTDTSAGFSTHIIGKNYTSYAHKRFQEQVLGQAIHAMHNVPIEKRDQSSMTMAVSTKRLDEAKDMIKEFRRRLCSHLEQDGEKDGVYHLAIALFPISDVTEAKIETVEIESEENENNWNGNSNLNGGSDEDQTSN